MREECSRPDCFPGAACAAPPGRKREHRLKKRTSRTDDTRCLVPAKVIEQVASRRHPHPRPHPRPRHRGQVSARPWPRSCHSASTRRSSPPRWPPVLLHTNSTRTNHRLCMLVQSVPAHHLRQHWAAATLEPFPAGCCRGADCKDVVVLRDTVRPAAEGGTACELALAALVRGRRESHREDRCDKGASCEPPRHNTRRGDSARLLWSVKTRHCVADLHGLQSTARSRNTAAGQRDAWCTAVPSVVRHEVFVSVDAARLGLRCGLKELCFAPS